MSPQHHINDQSFFLEFLTCVCPKFDPQCPTQHEKITPHPNKAPNWIQHLHSARTKYGVKLLWSCYLEVWGHNSFQCVKQQCLSLLPPLKALTFLSFLSFERFRFNAFDLFPNVKFRHCVGEKVQQSKFLLFFRLCEVQGSTSMKLQLQQFFFLLPLWSSRFYRHEGSLPTFFFSLPWNSKFCRCKGSTATTFFSLSPMCSFDIFFFRLCGKK